MFERKIQKVRFVVARPKSKHSRCSFDPDFHRLADFHLLSDETESCAEIASDRADSMSRRDLLRQPSEDRKNFPFRGLVAIGEQKTFRDIAGLLQSQPVIVLVENLENGQHAVCVWQPTDTAAAIYWN